MRESGHPGTPASVVQSRDATSRPSDSIVGRDTTGTEGATARARSRRGADALAVAIYMALAIGMFWHVWTGHPATVSIYGLDQYNSMWLLNWFPFAASHGLDPLHTRYLNYPHGVNTLVVTSTPLLAYAGAPITAIFGPVATYNVLLTLALAGSATAMYALARRFSQWRFAAFAAGLLYGFSPYVIAQDASHLHLSFVVLPPLIGLVFHDIVVRQRGRAWPRGILLGLLVVAQFFIAVEVLTGTLVILAVTLLAVAIVGRREIRSHLRFAVTGLACAAGVALVLLAYPTWYLVHGPGHINGPIQLVPQAYRADLLGPIVPDRFQMIAPGHLAHIAQGFANSEIENGSYLGVTLLGVLVIGTVVLRRRRLVQVAVVGGLAAFVLSLGGALAVHSRPAVNAVTGAAAGSIPLPEGILAKSSLLANTIPARYALFCSLFAALLLAVILDTLHQSIIDGRLRPWRVGMRSSHVADVVCGAVCVVAFIPLLPSAPYVGLRPVAAPAYFSSTAFRMTPAGSAVLVYPMASSFTGDPVSWQMLTGPRFEMPGGSLLVPGPSGKVAFEPDIGYTIDTPLTRTFIELYRGTPPPMSTVLQRQLRAQIRRWRIASLVAFAQGTKPAAVVPYLTWMVGRRPSLRSGAYVWTDLIPR